jgi:two-component system NtrC family sensor kinase
VSLVIQPMYKNFIHPEQISIDLDMGIDFLVGDESFLSQNQKNGDKLFLISKADVVSTQTLALLKPSYFFTEQEIQKSCERLTTALRSEKVKIEKKYQIQKIKFNIEEKRSELEQLNRFLQDESDVKKVALNHFHDEELSRKNKEKKLLSFLDYLNSEYEKSDFILDVLKTIWLDLKKIGNFYRLGFVIQNHHHKRYVIEFDGKIDRTKAVENTDALDNIKLNQFLADVFKRPVGKLVTFLAEKDSNKFVFFFEVQGHDYSSSELDLYMSDRISLLSIVIQRWYSESTEIQILKQWQQLFKSYQDPVHVIDSEHNLIQSNYNQDSSNISNKCFRSLAGRTTPCLNCPLVAAEQISASDEKIFVQVKNIDFEIVKSDFLLNKKRYYFMIYENRNEIGLLKSNLIQAEKLATIGQLSNHLAHELNNPLTGLKLYAELLLSNGKLASPIYENDMSEVLKAVLRSQTILLDLNQFANETETELTNLDFSEIVKKTMTLLKSILRNHRIFTDLKPVQISAQPTYLQQVLFNLIKNACQAMSSKGTLKIFQIESEKHFDFIIEDDGPGVPKEISNQIFRPFFTTKQIGQGTGLGLFISYKLMRRMNAELIYNDKFRNGTQFILRFNK